ncbi:MAG: hypothetical protein K8U03_00650 [Planctomycetia bacterium]|nr:hypothetical protein [Planctomycetia bacterium]
MTKVRRPKKGRLLFYTRDSGGKHETTPGQYVGLAASYAAKEGLAFDGTATAIEGMIGSGRSTSGDLFLDYDVKGNQLTRDALSALIKRIETDPEVTHVYIPRRDRLARPDHAAEGMLLETSLRMLGVSLVFMDKVLPPRQLGHRDSLSDILMSAIDYDRAGNDRRELAQKILLAQLTLAQAGFTTGGRPPYGFRRWLVKIDGTAVRELVEGERVRMAGHHVVWLPVPNDHPEMRVIYRILELIKEMPATRIAKLFTKEGISTPDEGRTRTDNGVTHKTSGVWHGNTIKNIAENSLLRAVVTYGRRSMGDQLRFDVAGPRALTAEDYRDDDKPKVIRNDAGLHQLAEANFQPLVDPDEHVNIVKILSERGGTQRGKARSRDPDRNPLGCRVVDLKCCWPMYRVPKAPESFKYSCGCYMQSHGAKCEHNQADGPTLVKIVIDALRQKICSPSAMEKYEARLLELATEESTVSVDVTKLAAKEEELREVRRDLFKVGRNLALAETNELMKVITQTFDEFKLREARLEREVQELRLSNTPKQDIQAEVNAARGALDRLPELIEDPTNLADAATAIRFVNAYVFLDFHKVAQGKRTLNRVHSGAITFGSEIPPVKIYEGPTGRRALNEQKTAAFAVGAKGTELLSHP